MTTAETGIASHRLIYILKLFDALEFINVLKHYFQRIAQQ